jgi:hypothetical protein
MLALCGIGRAVNRVGFVRCFLDVNGVQRRAKPINMERITASIKIVIHRLARIISSSIRTNRAFRFWISSVWVFSVSLKIDPVGSRPAPLISSLTEFPGKKTDNTEIRDSIESDSNASENNIKTVRYVSVIFSRQAPLGFVGLHQKSGGIGRCQWLRGVKQSIKLPLNLGQKTAKLLTPFCEFVPSRPISSDKSKMTPPNEKRQNSLSLREPQVHLGNNTVLRGSVSCKA